MHFLNKCIRDALNRAIKYQHDSAKFYRTARLCYDSAMKGYGDTEEWMRDAAAWQSLAASTAEWARSYREQWERYRAEYDAAANSLVKVKREWYQRMADGSLRPTYHTNRELAIHSAWAHRNWEEAP